MNNLIKNELTKIFHKKAIYIILIVTIIFMILSAVLTKIFDNADYEYSDSDISYYENEIKSLDKNNPEDKETYVMFKSMIETQKLKNKYERGSWQAYIVESKVSAIIENMIRTENTAEYDKYKKEYDDLITKMDTGDWKHFVNEELEIVKNQIAQIETANANNVELQNLKTEKQVLEWRLQKDISYGNSKMNDILTQWQSEKQNLIQFEEQEKTKSLTYEEKSKKQETEARIAVTENAIVNGVPENVGMTYINETYSISTEANSELISATQSYGMFIVIAVVMIAGTIISEEFSRGTIKLLLVRPYKRVKIIIAKFISCLVILILAIVVISLMQFIIGGITYGFNSYNNQTIIYNFNTGAVETIGLLKYWAISTLVILPQYLLIMTLAFALSIIFNNTPVSIALPLLGMMGAEIINTLAYQYEKAKFLIYFVTPNWDFTKYLFGKMPTLAELSVPFSIIICIIYFVIMAVTSLIVFKKREIKNV